MAPMLGITIGLPAVHKNTAVLQNVADEQQARSAESEWDEAILLRLFVAQTFHAIAP